jgi:hypothetical protein
MFGVYVPQLLDSTLIARLALLATLAAILVHHLRIRHGTLLAEIFVGGGWTVGIAWDIANAVSFDLGPLGRAYRDIDHVNLPDWLWSIHFYFAVGRGAVASMLGIVCGALLLVAWGYVRGCRLLKDGGRSCAGPGRSKSDETPNWASGVGKGL